MRGRALADKREGVMMQVTLSLPVLWLRQVTVAHLVLVLRGFVSDDVLYRLAALAQ
jgi:hypothetical protein